MGSYKMWSFVMEFFQWALAKCFQVSSTLWLIISTSLFFMAQQNSARQLFHVLLVHSSVGEYICYFHFGEIMNNTAINICVQIFLWTQSGIAGSYGNSMYDVQDQKKKLH